MFLSDPVRSTFPLHQHESRRASRAQDELVPATGPITVRTVRHTSGLTYGFASGTPVAKYQEANLPGFGPTMTNADFAEAIAKLPLAVRRL